MRWCVYPASAKSQCKRTFFDRLSIVKRMHVLSLALARSDSLWLYVPVHSVPTHHGTKIVTLFFRGCVHNCFTCLPTATSAVILKTEHEHRLSSISGDNVFGTGVRVGRGEDAVATGNGHIMDSAQSTTMKQSDYVVGQ